VSNFRLTPFFILPVKENMWKTW